MIYPPFTATEKMAVEIKNLHEMGLWPLPRDVVEAYQRTTGLDEFLRRAGSMEFGEKAFIVARELADEMSQTGPAGDRRVVDKEDLMEPAKEEADMGKILTDLQELSVVEQDRRNGGTSFLTIFEDEVLRPKKDPLLSHPRLNVEKEEPPPRRSEVNRGDTRDSPVLAIPFMEWAKYIRDTLESIRGRTQLSRDNFKDTGLANNFFKLLTEDLDRADWELRCFLDYLRLRSPVSKVNTVHNILEELLAQNEKRLREKNISIVKRQYEKDLPETRVEDEQLRYILNWVIDSAIRSAHSNGKIGIYTKSFEMENNGALGQGEGRQIEVFVASSGMETGAGPSVAPAEAGSGEKQNGKSVVRVFVEEIVRENGGILKPKVDHQKQVTQISLILPVERRRLTSYLTTKI
jgi:hypothetical protein